MSNKKKRTPNDEKSIVKNKNNEAYQADKRNTAKQKQQNKEK